MSLPSPTFTRRAVTGAIAAFAGASMLASLPAGAQQISRATKELTQRVLNDPSITTATNCDNYHPEIFGASALCLYRQGQLLEQENRELRTQRDALKAQARALKAHEGEVDRTTNCITRLVEFKAKHPSDFAKLGTITKANACDIADRVAPRASLRTPEYN